MLNASDVIVEMRAIVNLDLKGFSTKSTIIDGILNSTGILQLQEGIADFIEDAIRRAPTSELPLWSSSGGDNAFVLYRKADDAQAFVGTLHGMSKQDRSEVHMHRRMLFHSGASFDEVAYHAPNNGENTISLAKSAGGGRGVTTAARMTASSHAGQFIVTKSFYDKLSPESQALYSAAFTLKQKRDTYRETRYIRFLTPIEASDAGDIGFPTNDIVYPEGSWPILWPLLMTGSSFHTVNQFTPDKWKGNDIALIGLCLLRNMIKTFPQEGCPVARRLFLLGDDEDVEPYEFVFTLHEGVPIRLIRMSLYSDVMKKAVTEAGHKEIPTLPFSLSTPLFRTDFHDNRIVANYVFVVDHDDDAGATYNTSRRLAYIHITGSDHSTQAAYVAAYEALWDAADIIKGFAG